MRSIVNMESHASAVQQVLVGQQRLCKCLQQFRQAAWMLAYLEAAFEEDSHPHLSDTTSADVLQGLLLNTKARLGTRSL